MQCMASADSFLNDFFTEMRDINEGVELEQFSFYSIRGIKEELE